MPGDSAAQSWCLRNDMDIECGARRKAGVGSLGAALADQKTPGQAKRWDNQFPFSSCRRRISPALQAKTWRLFLTTSLARCQTSQWRPASGIVTRSLVGLTELNDWPTNPFESLSQPRRGRRGMPRATKRGNDAGNEGRDGWIQRHRNAVG